MKVRAIRRKPRYVSVYRGTAWGSLRYTRKHCELPAKPADLKTMAWFNKVDELCDQGVPWQDAIDQIAEAFER